MHIKLKKSLEQNLIEINDAIVSLLPDIKNYKNNRLISAIYYATVTKAKRIRPFLVMIISDMFGGNKNAALNLASAIEFIHIYSLIHDDLPAMDDDDFRRGAPTCHKKYDDATAILAGDALLTFAFEILSSSQENIDPEIRCEIIYGITKAIGFDGMAGGQMIDLEAKNKAIDNESDIDQLHLLKTGKIIISAVESSLILNKIDGKNKEALMKYAKDIGLAFQIRDDILDYEEEKSNPDKNEDHANIANIIGLKKSKEKLDLLIKNAKKELEIFGTENEHAEILRELANYIGSRDE